MVSLGLFILRVVVGGIMMVHGYAKVFGGPGKSKEVSPEAEKLLGKGFGQQMEYGGIANVSGFLQSVGVSNAKPAAIALMATELGGGLALVLGWRTRPAALAIVTSQAVAIQKVHLANGMLSAAPDAGWELNAALAAAAGALVLTGPGAIALD